MGMVHGVKGRAGSWWWGALPKDSGANRVAGRYGEDAKQAFEFAIRSSELYQNYRESILFRCWGQRANSFHGLRMVSADAENMGDEITGTPFKDRKYLSTFID